MAYNQTLVHAAKEFFRGWAFGPSKAERKIPTVVDIPENWVSCCQNSSREDFVAKIAAVCTTLSPEQFLDQDLRLLACTLIIENALLGVPAKAKSTVKTAIFLDSACVGSLKEAAVTFRDNLQYLQTTFGAAEMTSLMKIYNLSTERAKRKKPRCEVDINSALEKLNLTNIQLIQFNQSEMDAYLERAEGKNQLFPYMDTGSTPLLPLGSSWNQVDQSIAARKEKILTIEGTTVVAEDLDELNKNEPKTAPFGRVLACVMRYMTLAACSGRIRISDAYAYIALLLDLSQKYSANLAIAYDVEFRRRLANAHDIALLSDEKDKTERCAKMRTACHLIIDSIVTQRQLEAVKTMGKRADASKGAGKLNNAPGKGGGNRKGKDKNAGKPGGKERANNNRPDWRDNNPYGGKNNNPKNNSGGGNWNAQSNQGGNWNNNNYGNNNWNNTRDTSNWNGSSGWNEEKGSFEEKLKGPKNKKKDEE